ncbi:hypothetical protein CYMTET_16459 [Cymbomonas tetramitiformis]|uniref:LysM domain-containing protein n=1 Tax=Cymbomonas tetramitiformis TaxID=36881 RepID=A0AAE0GBZ3_9CHLO|nr:hypothetical protein CYMTET_16459 [Cymbomonas tetramitiformis]
MVMQAYTVENGETLSSVSHKFDVSLSNLVSFNPHLRKNPNHLQVGHILNVPAQPETTAADVACMSLAIQPIPSLTTRSTSPTSPRNSVPSPTHVVAHQRPAVYTNRRPSHFNTKSSPVKVRTSTRQREQPVSRNKDITHRVVSGESLYRIATNYSTSVSALQKLNKLDSNTIRPGTELIVRRVQVPRVLDKAGSPFVSTVKVKNGDTLGKIAEENGIHIRKLQKINGLTSDKIQVGQYINVADPLGKQKPKFSAVRQGWRRTYRTLLRASASSEIAASTVIGKADGNARENNKHPRVDGKSLSTREKPMQQAFRRMRLRPQPQQRMACPVQEGYFTSGFGMRWGRMHEGLDLAADVGAPVLAVADGVVTYSGWNGNYGRLLCLSHGSGFTTRYAHCDSINQQVGDLVWRKDKIATVGETGRATGPHLHFEVRFKGLAKDPLEYIAY